MLSYRGCALGRPLGGHVEGGSHIGASASDRARSPALAAEADDHGDLLGGELADFFEPGEEATSKPPPELAFGLSLISAQLARPARAGAVRARNPLPWPVILPLTPLVREREVSLASGSGGRIALGRLRPVSQAPHPSPLPARAGRGDTLSSARL